jgi:hypothetical protein
MIEVETLADSGVHLRTAEPVFRPPIEALPRAKYLRALAVSDWGRLGDALRGRCVQCILAAPSEAHATLLSQNAPYDLIVFADALAGRSPTQLAALAALMQSKLTPDGHCLILSRADGARAIESQRAAARFIAAAADFAAPTMRRRTPLYSLDLLERALLKNL